jgi:uncharacterized membrane protein YcaP (DUF421 family)
MEYIIIGLQVITLLLFILCELGAFDKKREGEALTIMEKGRLDVEAMKSAGLTFDRLFALAREKGVFNLGDMDIAVLEADGALSLLPKPMHRALNPGDFNFAPVREGRVTPVVIEGELLSDAIEATGAKAGEVVNLLEQRGRTVDGIALATINEAGRVDVFEYMQTPQA